MFLFFIFDGCETTQKKHTHKELLLANGLSEDDQIWTSLEASRISWKRARAERKLQSLESLREESTNNAYTPCALSSLVLLLSLSLSRCLSLSLSLSINGRGTVTSIFVRALERRHRLRFSVWDVLLDSKSGVRTRATYPHRGCRLGNRVGPVFVFLANSRRTVATQKLKKRKKPVRIVQRLVFFFLWETNAKVAISF